MKEIAEKVRNDKDYVVRQMERASPLEQLLSLFPVDSNTNLIGVRRTNFPTTKKKREWLISYEDSELVTPLQDELLIHLRPGKVNKP